MFTKWYYGFTEKKKMSVHVETDQKLSAGEAAM